MVNIADRLIENILRTKNPTVVGLDPDWTKIPACYKASAGRFKEPFEAVAEVIWELNRDIIDTVCPYVPAVKPQAAFYEKYGHFGIRTLEWTIQYAKSRGLIVIEDAKRNDIGNTAQAYAEGHLGEVELPDGSRRESLGADFLTVTPFLGSESLSPFFEVCESYGKGVFVLVKTSNASSGELQDIVTTSGLTVSQSLAVCVAAQTERSMGKYGYSPIGAVVGATYPEEARSLRALMPKSLLLVPGYGAQGGGAKDVVPCFCADGLGAIVNSSRGILYTHMTDAERQMCTKEAYLDSVRCATLTMREELYAMLKEKYAEMIY